MFQRNAIGFLLVFIFTVAASISLCTEEKPLLIFGDSLSDTGMGYTLSQSLGAPPIPPSNYYYEGRYSNGPNWVDYAAQSLKVPHESFAVGGALTGSENSLSSYGYKLGGLSQQIDRYETAHTSIPPGATVVIEIGANNFLTLLLTPTQLSPSEITFRTEQAMGDIHATLVRLQKLGAKRIILWNLPDLGKMAAFKQGLPLNRLSSLMSHASAVYNSALLRVVHGFNSSSHDTQVFYYDLHQFFNTLFDIDKSSDIDITPYAIHTVFCNPPIVTPKEELQKNFIFYDQIHPTTEVCKLCAEDFVAFLQRCE